MRFLYVGRLSREKSVTRLVDAFRLVLEQMPSARLSIVGDGPQAEELQSQAAGMTESQFEIANHAWSHGNFALLSPAGLRAQVLWTQA